MNRAAKFITIPLGWKNYSLRHKTNESKDPSNNSLLKSTDLAEQGLVNDKGHAVQSSLSEETLVCSIKHSPYRILRAAESGDFEAFVKIFNANPKRIDFQDKHKKTALHFAAYNNHLEIIQFIVNHTSDINVQDANGETALHYAVKGNAVDSVNYLLEEGADSSVVNHDMNGPIHVAVILDRVHILKTIVKHKDKVDVMLGGQHGRTALHFAAIYDHDECARILLSLFNCCPKKTCSNGSYAIHEAAKSNGSGKTLEAILEWGEKVLNYPREVMMRLYDAEGNVPLHSAVHSGDIKAVELCLKSGAVLSTQQHDLSTPVHLACSQGAMDIIKLMFSLQPEEKASCLKISDVQQFTPLHCAALFDHEELVRYLVKENADMNALDKEGRSPLLLAGARGSWQSVTALIELGSNMLLKDKNNRNIFHHIVLNGGPLDKFTELFSKKTKHPVNDLLNDRDFLGCTPLHYASRDGQFKTIQSLLQMGAVINLKDNDNQSPLHFAARFGRLNTVKHLIESRKGHLIINEMDGQGLTPLHICSQNGHTKVVRFLLIKGALLHRDHKGRTPLHLAAINGHVETMQQLLLVHSHLLDQVDKDGNSALTFAAIHNRSNVASTLLSLECRLSANNDGMSPMDYAITNRNSEVTHVMVLHPKRSEEIMKLKIKKYSSLREGLISNMPDVMKSLLDKGITKANNNEDSIDFAIKYDFNNLADEEVDPTSPLFIMNLMVIYGKEDLLSHPLCVKYLETKWNSYGMYFHVINMSFYLILLASITCNGLKIVDVTNAAHLKQNNDMLNHSDLHTMIHNMISDDAEGRQQTEMVVCTSSLLLVFVALNILKEFYQIYQQRLRYFLEFINILEWMLYISTGSMVVLFLFLNVNSCYLYMSTAVSVFIAWFNLLFFLQRFNRGGIYVVMFLEILSTLLKVIFLFSVLIIAFGLSFYILFAKFDIVQSGKGFGLPILSMIRVGTMMLGEIDFIGTFLRPILFIEDTITIEKMQLFTSLFFLVMFIVLMPILLMNLLIGLAVGDIETVRKDAQLKRLTMQVNLHTDLERKLPHKFISMTDKKMVYEYPNRCLNSTLLTKIFHLFANDNARKVCYRQSIAQANEIFNYKMNMVNQLSTQRKKIRELGKQSEMQLELLRLIIQKMEIQTENDLHSTDDEGEETMFR